MLRPVDTRPPLTPPDSWASWGPQPVFVSTIAAPNHQPIASDRYETRLPLASLAAVAPPILPTLLADQAGASLIGGANSAFYEPRSTGGAVTYLKMVELRLRDKPDNYNHFLDILEDFKSQRIDILGVIDQISSIFLGDPTLILEFNRFLPQDYHIGCAPDGTKVTVTTPSGTSPAAGNFKKYRPSKNIPAVVDKPSQSQKNHSKKRVSDTDPPNPPLSATISSLSPLPAVNEPLKAEGSKHDSGTESTQIIDAQKEEFSFFPPLSP